MSQAVVREELTLIEMCSRRTHSAAFHDWCGAHSANVAGIRVAVADLQTRLLDLVSEGGGEGNPNNVGPISYSLHVVPRSRNVSLY